jgi:hypothetical protein
VPPPPTPTLCMPKMHYSLEMLLTPSIHLDTPKLICTTLCQLTKTKQGMFRFLGWISVDLSAQSAEARTEKNGPSRFHEFPSFFNPVHTSTYWRLWWSNFRAHHIPCHFIVSLVWYPQNIFNNSLKVLSKLYFRAWLDRSIFKQYPKWPPQIYQLPKEEL